MSVTPTGSSTVSFQSRQESNSPLTSALKLCYNIFTSPCLHELCGIGITAYGTWSAKPEKSIALALKVLGISMFLSTVLFRRAQLYHELSMVGLNFLTLCNPFELPWESEITPYITLSALPFLDSHRHYVIDNNMAVLSITEEHELRGIGIFSDPITQQDWHDSGIAQLVLPVMDNHPPTLEQIEEGVSFINEKITGGQRVLVHCKGGRGRSALLVICYFIQYENMSYDDAFVFIKRQRFVVYLNPSQERVARDYSNSLFMD